MACGIKQQMAVLPDACLASTPLGSGKFQRVTSTAVPEQRNLVEFLRIFV
jgi:hypothetical protein